MIKLALKPNQYLKFTKPGCVGSVSGVKLEPHKWLPPQQVVLCESGYHVCRPGHLAEWVDDCLWIVDARGERRESKDKIAFVQICLVRRLHSWDWRQAQLFAAWCAEQVLPIYESAYPNDNRVRDAIQARKDWANGLIDTETWNAARDAARFAAGRAVLLASLDAVSAAAWCAAIDEKRSAARYSAWSAAREAARSAARDGDRDAAWYAAWYAAIHAQNRKLHEMIGLQMPAVERDS